VAEASVVRVAGAAVGRRCANAVNMNKIATGSHIGHHNGRHRLRGGVAAGNNLAGLVSDSEHDVEVAPVGVGLGDESFAAETQLTGTGNIDAKDVNVGAHGDNPLHRETAVRSRDNGIRGLPRVAGVVCDKPELRGQDLHIILVGGARVKSAISPVGLVVAVAGAHDGSPGGKATFVAVALVVGSARMAVMHQAHVVTGLVGRGFGDKVCCRREVVDVHQCW